MYIYRASYTKDGVTYYAKYYGKKAFKIWIGKERKTTKKQL